MAFVVERALAYLDIAFIWWGRVREFWWFKWGLTVLVTVGMGIWAYVREMSAFEIVLAMLVVVAASLIIITTIGKLYWWIFPLPFVATVRNVYIKGEDIEFEITVTNQSPWKTLSLDFSLLFFLGDGNEFRSYPVDPLHEPLVQGVSAIERPQRIEPKKDIRGRLFFSSPRHASLPKFDARLCVRDRLSSRSQEFVVPGEFMPKHFGRSQIN